MNTTKKMATKLLALLCIMAVTQPGFCISLQGLQRAWLRFKINMQGWYYTSGPTGEIRIKPAKNRQKVNINSVEINGMKMGVVTEKRTGPVMEELDIIPIGPKTYGEAWSEATGRHPNTVYKYKNRHELQPVLEKYVEELEVADRRVYFNEESNGFVAPDGEGVYDVFELPKTETFYFSPMSGKYEPLEGLLVQRVDAPEGVSAVKLISKETERHLAVPPLKPMPELDVIPQGAKELWDAIGGQRFYSSIIDFQGDTINFVSTASQDTLNALFVGKAQRELDETEVYFLLQLPVDEIRFMDVAGEIKIYRKGSDVILIKAMKDNPSGKIDWDPTAIRIQKYNSLNKDFNVDFATTYEEVL